MSVGAVSNSSLAKEVTENQEVTQPEQQTQQAENGTEFESFLRGLLTPNGANQVNEEELFSALIQERVNAAKGEEAAAKFSELFNLQKSALTKADGYVPVEDAAKNALRLLRDDGAVSAEEADTIYSEAFAGAQLDAQTETLFDGRGGAGDATIALEEMEKALTLARAMIDRFADGTETAAARPLDEGTAVAGSVPAGTLSPDALPDVVSPEGTTVDGAEGFLFKPVSESDGTLAVLVPEILKEKVESVVLLDPLGAVLEEGHSTGYGDLGTREKFAFSKPGGSYPNDLTVEVRLHDGSVKQYKIADPSQRYD